MGAPHPGMPGSASPPVASASSPGGGSVSPWSGVSSNRSWGASSSSPETAPQPSSQGPSQLSASSETSRISCSVGVDTVLLVRWSTAIGSCREACAQPCPRTARYAERHADLPVGLQAPRVCQGGLRRHGPSSPGPPQVSIRGADGRGPAPKTCPPSFQPVSRLLWETYIDDDDVLRVLDGEEPQWQIRPPPSPPPTATWRSSWSA